MDDEHVNPAPEPRVPNLDDLLLLRRSLNAAGHFALAKAVCS